MPSINNVVLTDHTGATDVTYVPVTENDGVFTLDNNTDGRPAFAKKLTMSTRRVSSNGSHVVTCKLVLPTIEPDQNGNDQVVGTNIVDIKCRLHSRSNTNIRTEMRKSLLALFADSTIVSDSVDNATGIF